MTNPEPKRGFDELEYKMRAQSLQIAMSEKEIEGLLLWSEAEFRYFTGFDTPFWQSPTRPWFLFIPLVGAPIAIIPEIGQAAMRNTWITDIRSWTAPNPADDGVSLLMELLHPLAIKQACLGVVKGHETTLRMPLEDWERLQKGLLGIKIKDATNLLQAARMIKSEAEIEKLYHICQIASETFGVLPKVISQKMSIQEIFRLFRLTALQHGADDVPYVVGNAGQGGYTDIISLPSKHSLRAGDVLMLDSGCVWDGYFCDFNRNWAIGKADEQSRRVYDVLWRATEAGIEATHPGMLVSDLFSIMSQILSEVDSSVGSIGRFGHGLGLQLTEQPSIAIFDKTELQPNMVFTLEPCLSYGDGLIMVHEENLVVTKSGVRLLTQRSPSDLPVINN